MTYKIELSSIDLDLTPLRDFLNKVEQEIEGGSNLVGSIKTAGNYIINEWIKTAEGKFKHTQGGYARGIVEGVHYPFNSDRLHYHAEHTEKYAIYLEKGFDSFDMKKALATSDKVRIAKDGTRYLIIPFRHGTPGTKSFPDMPNEVYQQAKNLDKSAISFRYREGVQQGSYSFEDAQLMKEYNPKKTLRNAYTWGGRLDFTGTKYEKYTGLVRFEANPNNNREITTGKFINKTSGEQQYSTYFTFRVMSENDTDGWIHPGLKPMNILGETIGRTKDNAEQMLKDGVMKDMQALGFTQ